MPSFHRWSPSHTGSRSRWLVSRFFDMTVNMLCAGLAQLVCPQCFMSWSSGGSAQVQLLCSPQSGCPNWSSEREQLRVRRGLESSPKQPQKLVQHCSNLSSFRWPHHHVRSILAECCLESNSRNNKFQIINSSPNVFSDRQSCVYDNIIFPLPICYFTRIDSVNGARTPAPSPASPPALRLCYSFHLCSVLPRLVLSAMKLIN